MCSIIEEESKEPFSYSIGVKSKVIVMMKSYSLEIR